MATAKKEEGTLGSHLEKNWDIKDRMYFLKGNKGNLVRILKSRNIYWFDEERGYEREIKFTKNQRTPFVEDFKGVGILEHIAFREGVLFVPKNKQVLQKILSLYHPSLGSIYEEQDNAKVAQDDLEILELEIVALNAAKEMDIEQGEAILRVSIGSGVNKMTSKEIKRDLILMARESPDMFLAIANDENVTVRNVAIKAVEKNIIKLAEDQRTFKWGANGRKLMTVPFDENPYSAIAAWFKTDEGIEVYQTIEKRLAE